MKILRRMIREMLLLKGYDVVPHNRFGVRPFEDIAALLHPFEPKVIFDVGGHHGETAIAFARRFPRATVHSFEPFGPAFEALQESAHAFPRIKPVKSALGNQSTKAGLFVNKFDPTNSLLPNAVESALYQPPGAAIPVGVSSVCVNTLDNYCREQDIPFLDCLKIDTQGFELRVLEGAETLLEPHQIGVVYAEVLFVPLYEGQATFHELYAFLLHHGFRLTGLYDLAFIPDHRLKWCDALFVCSEALSRRRMGNKGP